MSILTRYVRSDQEKAKFPHSIRYTPPDDIASSYYPALGPYSCRDTQIVDNHMAELSEYVVVVSWWGRKEVNQRMTTDTVVPDLLKSAEKFGTKIAFHFEPYEGRTAQSTKQDIEYIIKKYGTSPSFYRDSVHNLPIIYLYNAFKTPETEWATIFDPSSPHTIRGTINDAIVIALYLEQKDQSFIKGGHFDGIYTYSASDGFTEGSSAKNWKAISKWAIENKKLVSISVGPGYDDTRIRPWNQQKTRSRNNGEYYDSHWEAAINSRPNFISVTSYNEWMQGTQIEPAIKKMIDKSILTGTTFEYYNYSPLTSDYYIKRTFHWSLQFCELTH